MSASWVPPTRLTWPVSGAPGVARVFQRAAAAGARAVGLRVAGQRQVHAGDVVAAAVHADRQVHRALLAAAHAQVVDHDEHPQTAALILSKVKPSCAAKGAISSRKL